MLEIKCLFDKPIKGVIGVKLLAMLKFKTVGDTVDNLCLLLNTFSHIVTQVLKQNRTDARLLDYEIPYERNANL